MPTKPIYHIFSANKSQRLSEECDRFSRSMVAPPNPLYDADDESLIFWVVETPDDLIDTVTTKVMMEELMET